MADKRISIVFDASLNASQMSSAVKRIQSEFEKINLSGAVQKEFNKMLTQLDEAVKDFSAKAAGKEITSAKDMRELEQSFDQIMRLYKQIQTEAKSLGGLSGEGLLKILPKNFGQEFDKAKQYLGDYKRAVEKNEREIKSTKEDLSKANKKKQTQIDKKQTLESKKIIEAYEKDELVRQKKQANKDIQNYKKQIQEKRAALENFEKEHENKITNSKKINKKFKDSEILQQEYDKLKADLSQKEAEVNPSLQKAIELYNKLDAQIKGSISQSDFNVNLDKITKDLQTAEKEVTDFTTKLQNLEQGPIESEKFEELRKEVEKLSGLDLSNLNPNAEGLKELEQIFTTLQAGKIQEAKEQLENLVKAANGMEVPAAGAKTIVNNTKAIYTEAERAAQEMERLKDQVLDFFSITNTVQIFKNAVRDAFNTIKELDAVMTETAVVTDFSIGDMWEKLPEYTDKASAMGSSIKDLYSATTLYYQQGLKTNEAMGLGVETMKMARIANMDATAATQAMTAALRGFNMEINDMNAQRINDVYSELAAVTAADTSQIATAMSKTASIASSANMEFETTAAFLAQIIETTQEAPETAGTALKTIIARFTEVKQLFDEGMLTGEDSEGEEININKIDAALKTVGISLKDFLTGSKGIDDIFLELASKWDTLDLATQRYIATTAAGSRQQSRFIAMMSNYDRTMELVNAANNSAGASMEQFNKTLDSLDAKLQRLQNAWAEFTMGLANNQVVKGGIDLLTMLLETVNKLTGATGSEGFGGLVTTFARFMVLFGALKSGKSFIDGIFGGLGKEGGIDLVQKIFPTLTAFQNVNSAAGVLKATLKGLEGGWAGLLGRLTKTKVFWSNTAIDIMAIGEGMGILGQQASAAGNSLALFGLGLSKITIIIMVVVAAITALVQIFKAIKASTPEGKLEAAKIATQEAGEAADAAAESYNNLKSALDSIAEKENSLEGLTRGTQEWRDAVQALNADVLALVNNYPELGAFLENKDGILTINTGKKIGESSVDSILKQYSDKIFKTQAVESVMSVRQAEAQKEVDSRNFSKVLNFESGFAKELYTETELQEALVKAYKSGELSQLQAKLKTESDLEVVNQWLEKNFTGYVATANKDFSFSDISSYSQKQNLQNQTIESQYMAAALQSMNLAVLQGEGGDVVSNMSSKLLSKGFQKAYETAYEELSSLTNDQKKQFVLDHADQGYTYERGKIKKGGVELKPDDIKAIMATENATEKYSTTLQNLADNLTERDNELLNQLISKEGQTISKDNLLKYTNYNAETDSYELNTVKMHDLAVEAGFSNAIEMANSFGLKFSELVDVLSESFETAGDRIIKARKSVVTNMSKYDAMSQTEAFGYQDEANYLALMEEIVGESYLSTLENLFSSLEITGDSSLISGALESFKQLGVTKESVAEIDELISNIDWSNPIEATKAITQEMKYGTSITKEFATAVKNSGSSFFGAESQVKHFLASADYEEIKADLTEVLETNGEIADTDISNLLGDFKSLNQLLKNTGMSASAAAKMIQSLIQGKLTVDQLSNAVLAAIANFDSLAGISSGIIDKMSNYDLGIDENQVTETLGSWSEVLMGNLKKGAYGNTQNFRILDFLFGTSWREGLEGAELRQEMERLALMVEQNAETMWHSWDDLAKGRNYKGEYGIDLDGLSISHNAQGGFDIAGYEAKTTSEIVDIIKNAYGVSREYAEMMVTDFKNNSLDMATALAENDYLAGIEAAKEELREFAGEKIIDESELKAIGDFYGKSIEDVRKALEISEDNVTHFWTDSGQIKQTKDLISELNNLKPNFAEQFREDEILNVTELQNALQDLRIPESAQAAIVEDFARLAKDGSNKIKAVLSDGTLKDIEVAAGQSIEQAIDQAEQDLQNEKLADAIASAFENIQAIKVKADINGLVDQIKTYLSQKTFTIKVEANIEGEKTTTVIPQQDSDDNTVTPQANTEAIESQMDEVFSPKTVDVNVSESSIADGNAQIDAMVEPRTLVIWVDFDLTGNGMDVIGGFLGAVGGHARGIENSPTEHDALVSEEGPELIQTKDGFYLTGQNGPEMAHINKGDTVYTAEETKQILKPRDHKIMSRFNNGLPGPRSISGYLDHLKSGEGSGGSSEDEDEEPWENSFDKLYNLIRQIDEEARQRERIERRYEELLKEIATSAKDLIQVSREELSQLEEERHLQEKLIAERTQQLSELQKTSNMTEYAWTEINKYGEQIIRINWDLINAIQDQETGDNVSDYISKLEEWVDSINEAESTLVDIEDTVNDIKERGEDEYFDLEEKIKDAIVKARESEIEQMTEIDNSINNATSDILDSLQKTLDRQREVRKNEETETELSNLRRQLAYLQQDTSGGNDLEIKELEKQIKEGSVDYTDQLIDQKISELQKQNEKASEQRQWQIELAQAQLDQYVNSGEIWNEVYRLMDEGLDKENGLVRGSQLDKLLKNGEGYESLSKIGQMSWLEELTDLIAQGLGYLELGRQLEDLQGAPGIPKPGESVVFLKDGKYYEGILQEDGAVKVGDKKYNNVYQGYDGRFYAGENYAEDAIRVDNKGNVVRPEKKPQQNTTSSSGSGGGYWSSVSENDSKKETKYPLLPEGYATSPLTTSSKIPTSMPYDLPTSMPYDLPSKPSKLSKSSPLEQFVDSAIKVGEFLQNTLPPWGTFATGGLADFTGPAWLDGTKARPEYVLNSVQTKGFLTLVDILDSIKSTSFKTNTQNEKGDTFDIDINIETVREEVDVDMVAEKVQKSVVSASKYRNNIFAKR